MKLNKQYQKKEAIGAWLLSLMIIFMNSYAQTLEVSGTVSTATTPVQNASVTFIDNSDTTRQFSALTNNSGYYSVSIVTSVHQIDNQPAEFGLNQNYPNPFSVATMISYRLNKPSDVLITIYDILGQEIKRFSFPARPAGTHEVVWDGLNNSGERVAAGVYFYRLQAGGQTLVKKMVFGIGVNNSSVSLSNMRLSKAFGDAYLQGFEFTVLIENTESTFPTIMPKKITNVVVQHNAILNFTVDEYINPNAAIIYLDRTQQIIRGFGAANILRWRPDMTADEIEKAFGTDEGQIGLTILRLRIPPNASEFSYNVPTAQAAHSLGVKIIASPWSPPASMKTNNSTIGGRLRESSYAAYAAHLKSFADFMASKGVPLYAISIQNEPDIQVTYESCEWNASEMLKFVKENAQDIGTDIIAAESFNFNHAMTDPILNDSTAASHVAIIGGHIYGGGLTSYPLAVSKGKEIWMTEHLDTDTTWTKVLATGKEIHDCMTVGMSAYVWWYIVRFYGPIKEDGNVSKRGYVMSQFARFVRPGYFRVFTKSPQRQIYITVYRDAAKIVIVAINYRSQPVEQIFVLKDGDAVSFTPYVTSATENCAQKAAIATSRGSFTATLAPSSITTFISQ
ncbi:MAG: T9SS type A sorting domain-containing protein [candidate division KSB1 bacterium]|nr:T9SS type A sorting domain-containing protein [candidate division KSB1 bacterium]